MPKIIVYEAEPGDWRFDNGEVFDDYYRGEYGIEVSEEQLAELVRLEEARKRLNSLLKELKAKEPE